MYSKVKLLLIAVTFTFSFILNGYTALAQVQKHYINAKTTEGLQEIFKYSGVPLPFVSSHRGGPEKNLPENHTVTFANTLRYTYSIIEIDPRYSKDSIIIVHHDPTLDRTTTGNGKVSEFTYEELQLLNLKDREGNPTKYKIQTLREMLEWAKGKTILVLDKKDVPLEARIKMVEDCNAEAYAIVMAYNFDEAKLCYELNRNIMMQVFINSPEKVRDFDQTGIPWKNVVVFVSHQIPEDSKIFDLIHQRGAVCILGTSRNLDREITRGSIPDNGKLKKEYNALLQMGVDILETDLPVEVSKLIFDDVPVHPSKEKYFRLSK